MTLHLVFYLNACKLLTGIELYMGVLFFTFMKVLIFFILYTCIKEIVRILMNRWSSCTLCDMYEGPRFDWLNAMPPDMEILQMNRCP